MLVYFILQLESHQDIVPAVLPMFHIYGFVCSLGCLLYNGSKVIALPKFTPELYINTLKNHKPHFLFTVPPIGKLSHWIY